MMRRRGRAGRQVDELWAVLEVHPADQHEFLKNLKRSDEELGDAEGIQADVDQCIAILQAARARMEETLRRKAVRSARGAGCVSSTRRGG